MSQEEKQRVQILAVSIDSHETSSKLARELEKRYPGEFDFSLLQDKDHKVIDRYGIFNGDGRGWPHPATYVIDQMGIVRWRFIEVDYKKRPTNEQILRALRSLT